jgi:hypothetical protein
MVTGLKGTKGFTKTTCTRLAMATVRLGNRKHAFSGPATARHARAHFGLSIQQVYIYISKFELCLRFACLLGSDID